MRGTISAIAPDGSYGQIAAEDGQRYSYWTSEIRNGPARSGQAVEFQMWQGQPVDIFIGGPAAPKARTRDPPPPAGAVPLRQQAAATPAPARFGATAPSAFAEALKGLPPADYWIKLFTSPQGRISRRQFWLHGVVPIVVCDLLLFWLPFVGILVMLALGWASICIGFKRFHDLGYPGWWSLAAAAAALLATLFTAASIYVNGIGLLAGVFWVVAALVGLAQLVLVYIRDGHEGPNQYGPDPLSA